MPHETGNRVYGRGHARRREALDKAGSGPPQQKVDDRNIAHFALDNEGESGWQEALQQGSIDVARVIRDDHAVTFGQGFEAGNVNVNAG